MNSVVKLVFPFCLRRLRLRVLLFGIVFASMGLQVGHAQSPGVRLATRQFTAPDGTPYLELQAEFLANGVKWLVSPDTLYRAAVTWSVVAYDSTGNVAGFSKATARTDDLPVPGDFLDIARIPLAPGPHVLELEVVDLGAAEGAPLKHEMVVEVDEPTTLDVSDLFLVQAVAPGLSPPTSLTRSGLEVLPLVDQRISEDAEAVPFYGELYGTDTRFGLDSAFLVVAGFASPDGDWIPETKRYIRMKGAPVLPLLETIPVPDAGVYELVVEVQTPTQVQVVSRSLSVEVLGSRVQDDAEAAAVLSSFVQEYQDRDSLLASIETLIPIAESGERRSIEYALQDASLRSLQAFLDQFWISREPGAPGLAWLEYQREVAIADEEYGACPNRQGHETDMGWILLRYGPPNTTVKRHNGTQYYPYEIWHYHKAGPFNNRRFLFYTPQVVGECFELLHSDHPREIRNADWLSILRTRELGHSVSQTSINQLGQRDTYSREEPEDLFFNPR